MKFLQIKIMLPLQKKLIWGGIICLPHLMITLGGGGGDVDISKENVELRDTCEFL